MAEQEFFSRKGYTNDPTRCLPCRQARRAQNPGEAETDPTKAREFFAVTCADCGAPTRVPFRPTQGRPVYCSNCFRTHQR